MRVPLSPTEISLNGPVILNDTEWYSMVIIGIPLALFVRGTIPMSHGAARVSPGCCSNGRIVWHTMFAADSLMVVVSFLLTPDVPASVLFTNNSCRERPRATRDGLRAREINGRCQKPHVHCVHPDANQALSVPYAGCRRPGRFVSHAPTTDDRSSWRGRGPKFD